MGKRTAHKGNHLLVEVGWEVCLQLGGIYTVLRSKAPMMVKDWGTRYCLVGPYNKAQASFEFETLPRTGYFGRAAERLEQKFGIRCHYGKWLVSGEPQTILIEYTSHYDRLNGYRYQLNREHGIETRDEAEVNDVILFGYLVAEFFHALTEVVNEGNEKDSPVAKENDLEAPVEFPILGQFHEWMAGVAIPVLHRRGVPLASTFTTHATLLGRYLASTDPNFYNNMHMVDPNRAAAQRGILPRFLIEKSAAQSATVFTTISGITAQESEKFLSRKPDVLTPNGLNIQRFTAIHEFQNLHQHYKRRIGEFVMGHFFHNYTFDIDKTLFMFTSGRYEYRNKGFDLFIESMARLNWKLKQTQSDLTVVAFLVTRAPHSGVNVDVLKNQMMFKDLSNVCDGISKNVGHRLLATAAMGKQPQINDVLDEYDQLRLKRLNQAWRQSAKLPGIATHNVNSDHTDAILTQLRACKLLNQPDSPVKVIFHPEFVTATSPLLGLDYEQFVRGCHLGVFPSYYEPWGYTPEECTAMGVPSVTSDLSGFGSYISENINEHADKGLYVIERRHKNFNDSAQQLCDTMFQVLSMSRRERVEQRNRVEAQSEKFDWRHLVNYYREAHTIALNRVLRR